MGTRLHQVVAVLNGKKTKTMAEITELHQLCQKPAMFAGKSRTYRPLNELDEKLPDETRMPPADAGDCIRRAVAQWVDYLDVVLTVDTGSTMAKADIDVDGKVILKDVPVLHLIFLEQQLNDVRKFIATLPTLDVNYDWAVNNTGMHVTKPVDQNRNVKVKQVVRLAAPTEHHPEQAALVDTDKWVGVYTERHFSTAIKPTDKRLFMDRVDRLIEAVKIAREKANSIDVVVRNESGVLFKHIFG